MCVPLAMIHALTMVQLTILIGFDPKGQIVDMVCDYACIACSYIWHLAEDWLGQKVKNCLFILWLAALTEACTVVTVVTRFTAAILWVEC